MCYSKNESKKSFNYIIHDENQLKKLGYTNKDEYFEERGYYKLTHLFRPSSTGSFQYVESLDYPIKAPNGEEFRLHVNKKNPGSGGYTWGYETYLIGNKLGFIECKKNDEGDWVAYRKQYQFVKFDPKTKQIIKIKAGQPYENVIDDFYSSYGGAEIIKLFNNKNIFDFPKPKNLIKHILKIASNQNSLILDFFAGSGTTAQAVMELNKEDGGNRKYILVQLPEIIENSSEFKTICDITRERVKRSNEMFDYQDKGFKSFKLVDSNFKINNMSNKDSEKAIEKNLFDLTNKIKEGRTTEDLVYEIILRNGHPLNLSTKLINEMIENHNVYYDENKNHLFIIEVQNNGFYSNESVLKIINKVYKGQLEFTIYFKDNHFKNDQDKLNIVEQIMFINSNIKIVII